MTSPAVPAAEALLTVHGDQFLRGGLPHQVISGGIHYFRIHPDLWEDRLLRLKALGLNTIETYVAWNVHAFARCRAVDVAGGSRRRRSQSLRPNRKCASSYPTRAELQNLASQLGARRRSKRDVETCRSLAAARNTQARLASET